MRSKKLLSAIAVGAIAATTVAMPVMAVDQGSVNVEFTTKIPVIRVAVPTSILAAVDPLEMNLAGTQIHSSDFTITNKSEVPVGIDVKSEVTLGQGVTLVDTKAKAEASTDSTKSEAWIGVAAQTSSNKYIETANKTAGDLTEADRNVATFKTDSTSNAASQTFYLDKAASSTTVYKIAKPVAIAAAGKKTVAEYKEELTYAQVYELTEDTAITDTSKLLAKLKTVDVYEGADDNDGTILTLLPAGKKDATYTSGKKYFTAGTDNKLESMAADTAYVYGEGGNGSNTAFRYIGKLGPGKTSWTDSDIDEMDITYSIYGLTDAAYEAGNVDDSYGLYEPNVAPTLPSTCAYTAGQDAEVTVNLGAGELAASNITSITYVNSGTTVSLPTERWSYSNGKLTFKAIYTTMLGTSSREHTIHFNDTAKTTRKITLEPAASSNP